jgi:hypothetical protein
VNRIAARLELGIVALLAVLAGCQNPRPPASAPPVAMDIAAEAERAFERREWVLAARLLREAIVHDGASLKLHYHLAIAASHVGLRQEAITEFRWVLAKAPGGSTEAQTARAWLAEAGVLESTTTSRVAAADETVGDSALSGRVVWTDTAAAGADPRRMQLILVGLGDGPTRERRYVLRTDEEGRFQFRRVVAGPYRLVNRVAGLPTWRLRVDLEPGKEQTLELTPSNSTRVRDDFPDPNR